MNREFQIMTFIRPFHDDDWPAVWSMLEPVFRAGETYPCPVDIDEAAARVYWIDKTTATFVAVDGHARAVGTYYIKPNQPGRGAHVCNCGYVTAASACGQGVASTMCAHSQATAEEMGFRAMQYNLVVSTNTGAVRLWEKNGLEIVARLPGAFHHATLGYVDAFVMFKILK